MLLPSNRDNIVLFLYQALSTVHGTQQFFLTALFRYNSHDRKITLKMINSVFFSIFRLVQPLP